MPWFEALSGWLATSDRSDSDTARFREDGHMAYLSAWLQRQNSGDDSVELLTAELDKFSTFRSSDGTTAYPQILIDAWEEDLTPTSAKKLLYDY